VNDAMPNWLKKSAGRPVLLRWVSKVTNSTEATLTCVPGTFLACADLAKKYQLQGLIFDQYGVRDDGWSPGIETNPDLVVEINRIANEFGVRVGGIGAASTAAGSVPSQSPSNNRTEPPPAPQFAPEARRFESTGLPLDRWTVMKTLDAAATVHRPAFGGWSVK